MLWHLALALVIGAASAHVVSAQAPTDDLPADPQTESVERAPQATDVAESQEADGSGTETSQADGEEPVATADGPIVMRDFLMLPSAGDYGRMPLHRDAVESALVTGAWKSPQAGADGPQDGGGTWEAVAAGRNGLADSRPFLGGYAVTTVESDRRQIMLLEAKGHAVVYVNGRPHTGDPYRLGWLQVPVELEEGKNEFLFHIASDQLSARLLRTKQPTSFNRSDITVPNVVRGQSDSMWGAVPIVNASREPLAGARIVCQIDGGTTLVTPVPTVPPLGVYKAEFQFPAASEIDGKVASYRLRLVRSTSDEAPSAGSPEEETLSEMQVELPVVETQGVHVRTYRSAIDGSVQQYAVRPAADDTGGPPSTSEIGVILALHGAGISCDEFAGHYSAKSWAHVVAPLGRRRYCYDWEDWGRTDALEALADALQQYPSDNERIYVTGHSMGGHGAWHLGTTYPARFAAIGPSAGWASYWSYGGGIPTETDASAVEAMLLRGYSVSDTLKLIGNLRGTGVCILHGEQDEVVPVAQSRFMRSRLADFHGNFAYFEFPGVGNPWQEMPLDAPQLMEFFRQQKTAPPAEQELIDFTTASPGVSHGAHWVSIEAQQQLLRPSRVAIRQDVERRTFSARTINVARLAIDVEHLAPSQPLFVAIDGQSLPPLDWPQDNSRLWFAQKDERWQRIEPPLRDAKGPHRYGTFKSVFDNDALLVYGTRGTAEENQWAKAKAQFDAETFWYRGNGSFEVMADTAFRADAQPDRNVVLYGNAETNAAWPALLSTSPVQVRPDRVRVGLRPEAGNDLAVLFVRPRPGSERALVGVVGGTGLVGMQITTRLRYFVSGVAYPDLLIYGPDVLTDGTSDVRAAGYFGLDWKVETGEIVWRDVAL